MYTDNDIKRIVEQTTTAVLEKLGLLANTIKLADAYRLWTRSAVDAWIRQGLLRKIKDGEKNSGVRLDRKRCEELAARSNRTAYYREKYESE
jgi:hypothetical protein